MLVLDVGLAAEEPQTTTTSYRSCISIQNSGNDDIPFVVAHILCPRGIANSAVSRCCCPSRAVFFIHSWIWWSFTDTDFDVQFESNGGIGNGTESKFFATLLLQGLIRYENVRTKEREVGQYLYRWHDKARQHGRPWPILKGASCCCCCCLWAGTSIIYFVGCRRIINVGWRM